MLRKMLTLDSNSQYLSTANRILYDKYKRLVHAGEPPSTRLTHANLNSGYYITGNLDGFRSNWVFQRQDSNFGGNVYIQLYTVGHCSQSSDRQ